MRNQINYFLLTMGSFLFFCSCVSKKQLIYLQDLKDINVSKTNIIQHTFQENDILKIDVTSLEKKVAVPYNKVPPNVGVGNSINLLQLNGYLVSNKKTINFPVLGLISVAGKNTEDLESYIKDRLEREGHLINPNVSVRLLNAKVTLLGEVKNPGTYTFTENNMTFLQALGLAGDLTIEGDRKNITLIRESNGQRTTTSLDLTSASWLSSHYQNIQPNDVVIVNPNLKKVTSAGLIGNISTFLSIASIVLSTIILIK